jgi:hypothetical protein
LAGGRWLVKALANGASGCHHGRMTQTPEEIRKARDEKLAAQLRANLKRRKAQARAMQTQATPPDPGDGDSPG